MYRVTRNEEERLTYDTKTSLALCELPTKYIKIKKYFYLSFIGKRISQILLKSVISELITYLS